jgi:hypothetical protein
MRDPVNHKNALDPFSVSVVISCKTSNVNRRSANRAVGILGCRFVFSEKEVVCLDRVSSHFATHPLHTNKQRTARQKEQHNPAATLIGVGLPKQVKEQNSKGDTGQKQHNS